MGILSWIFEGIFLCIFFILGLSPILLPAVFIFSHKKKEKQKLIEEAEIVREIVKLDPNFNVEEFKEQAANCFIKAKESIIRNDLKTLMTLETTELYNMHKSELEMTKLTGLIEAEHIEDIDKILITSSKIENNLEKITLRVNVTFKKLKVDRKQAALIYLEEGSTSRHLSLQFVRSCTAKTKKGKEFALQECPNCGAPVEINVQGNCVYCRSVLINGNHSWVLNKIDNYHLL